MAVTFDDKTPIYLQIICLIKRDIVTKKIRGGEKLPSVREMAENMKVNPNTVQRAYQELEREGTTYTQRGMGTFITEDEEKHVLLKRDMAKEVITTFVDGMTSLGFKSDEIVNVVNEYLKK